MKYEENAAVDFECHGISMGMYARIRDSERLCG